MSNGLLNLASILT